MSRLPDAPWIRDAEQNGVDEGPDVTCPCCGSTAEQFVLDENHEILGCDRCTNRMDVWDWWERYGGGAEKDEED